MLPVANGNLAESRASEAKTPNESKEDKMKTDNTNTIMREFYDAAEVGNYKGVDDIVAKVHAKCMAIEHFMLANIYHHGVAVGGSDHYTEVLYLEKAAALGYKPAIYNLALAHGADTWIELNTVKSMKMMRKLADSGYEPAVEMMEGLDQSTASSTDISARYAQRAMLQFMDL